jgi:hypothetical protein
MVAYAQVIIIEDGKPSLHGVSLRNNTAQEAGGLIVNSECLTLRNKLDNAV